MFWPSTSRCPVLSVAFCRSEPARSIIESLPSFDGASLWYLLRERTDTCSTACERDETSFTLVASVVR